MNKYKFLEEWISQKEFCEHCLDYVDYDTHERVSKDNINGLEFEYKEVYCTCKKCNKEIYTSWYNDGNLKSYNRAFINKRNEVINE